MSDHDLTQPDIVAGLRRLGLPPGALVEVHSSLSALGRVAGGAEAVVGALIEAVTSDGTIVMSAYPVSPPVPLTDADRALGLTWKVRRLAPDSHERTGMGLIADTFRRRADVRCGHSFFRTCAWGRDAEWHTEGYGGLLAADGWCLLIGVGVDRCSSMHAAESAPLPPAISALWALPDAAQRAYDPQEWSVGYGGAPDDAWRKVWDAAERAGQIRHATIGRAGCQLFRARALIGRYRRWREADPYGLYGVGRPPPAPTPRPHTET